MKSDSPTNWLAELEQMGREADKRAPAPEDTPSATFKTVTHVEHIPVCPHCGQEMGEKSDCWDPDYKDCWRHRACYDKGPFFIHWPKEAADTTNDQARLRKAITEELDAVTLYQRSAADTINPAVRKVFLDIAQEEKVHAGEFTKVLETLDPEQAPAEQEGKAEAAGLVSQGEKQAEELEPCRKCGAKMYWAPFRDDEYLHPHRMSCGHTNIIRRGRVKSANDVEYCLVCKEPWSSCLGRHGSKPCACGSGKPRNKCDCPGGTPDKEASDGYGVFCPLCGKEANQTCRCGAPPGKRPNHDLDALKRGHGYRCENGHRWGTTLDGVLTTWDGKEEKQAGDLNHIYVTGLPGSGKTTLGQRLAKQFKLPLISLDGVPGMTHTDNTTDLARQLIAGLNERSVVEGVQLLGLQDELQGKDLRRLDVDPDELAQRLVTRGFEPEPGKLLKGPQHLDAAKQFLGTFAPVKEAEFDCPWSCLARLTELGFELAPREKLALDDVASAIDFNHPVLLHLDDGDKIAYAYDDERLYFEDHEPLSFDLVKRAWSSREGVILSHTGAEYGRLLKQASVSNLGDLTQLKQQMLVDFIIQHHLAERAGPHFDVRFGTPQTGLFSWATKHELPGPGEKRMLFQQPIHPYGYGDFQGKLTGYGQGYVKRHHKGKITIEKVGPDKVQFTTDETPARRFVMVRPQNAKRDTHWLLINRDKHIIPEAIHDDATANPVESSLLATGQPVGPGFGQGPDSGVDRALADPGFVQSLAGRGGAAGQPDLAEPDAGGGPALEPAHPGSADQADQPGRPSRVAGADAGSAGRGDKVAGDSGGRVPSSGTADQAMAVQRTAGQQKPADEVKRPPIVAVDVDGTVAKDYEKFDPDHIPDPRPGAKKWLEKFKSTGALIVFHTVRGKEPVLRAWAKKHKLPFDYINEHPYQPEGSSDKLFADVYWDNMAVDASGPLDQSGPEVLERLNKVSGDTAVVGDPQIVYELLLSLKE